MFYLFLKWLHLMALISWMAGILYLFRLFIYHSQSYGKAQSNHKMLMVMEKRLLNIITRPAMTLTWISGLSMAATNHAVTMMPWFMMKLICVILLTFITELAGRYRKKIVASDGAQALPTTRKLRWLNELPTILMAIIIALVIFRPFS